MGDFGRGTLPKARAASDCSAHPCARAIATTANAWLSRGLTVPGGRWSVTRSLLRLGILVGLLVQASCLVLGFLLRLLVQAFGVVRFVLGILGGLLVQASPGLPEQSGGPGQRHATGRHENKMNDERLSENSELTGVWELVGNGEEGEPWHERIGLAATVETKSLVLTPGADMYVEEIETSRVADFKQDTILEEECEASEERALARAPPQEQ